MRNNWRDKVRNWFFIEESIEETDETEKRETRQKSNRQDLETKMVYQYPEKTPFRYPIIEDEQCINKEVPAYKRSHDMSESHSSQSDRQPIQEPIETGDPVVEKRRKPFKPTRVPSPIYGYQKREAIKKVENIPTFIRKQKEEDDGQQEEKHVHESTERSSSAETIPANTKLDEVKQEEREELEEPITITQEIKEDVIDHQEQDDVKEKQTQRIHSRQRSKQPDKKRSAKRSEERRVGKE